MWRPRATAKTGSVLRYLRTLPHRDLVLLAGDRKRRGGRLRFGRRRTRLLAIERQADGHARALAERRLHIDLAAMQGDQAFDDRQSEPGAVVPAVIGRPRLEERRTDTRQVGLADADAGILDGDRDVGT